MSFGLFPVIVLILAFAGVAALVYSLRGAVEGYEDEAGFHFRKKGVAEPWRAVQEPDLSEHFPHTPSAITRK